MTRKQIEAFAEMERLLSVARCGATLAFPDSDVRLHSEFQVGIHEPADFALEMKRAGKVIAACPTHAAPLDDRGWLDEDTAALAADALYKMCQSVQNAARNRLLLDEV